MLKNNIKIGWRNIRKNRGFALLNTIGLTLGITCFLLLAAYIVHEMSYDRFIPNSDRIAYVSYAYKSPGDAEFVQTSVTPTAVAPTLEKEFAEVEKAVRLYAYNAEGLIQKGDQQIKETALKFADEAFFEVIAYPFLEGDAKNSLGAPYQIVLSEAMAEKYFPAQSAIGKTLLIDGQPWKISGIIPNPPSYTQLKFSAILSNKHLARYKELQWDSANDVTLALLKKTNDFAPLQKKANAYIQHLFADMFKSGAALKLEIQPLPDIHLHSKIGSGNLLYVYIFAAMALGILVIACINFANLSLARSAERTKEIGVKKVLGASRKTLFFNFLTECSIMVGIALFAGLLIAYFLLPAFARYVGTPIEFNGQSGALFYIVFLLFAILISLLASSWPAFVIANFTPINNLKRTTTKKQRGLTAGNALIVFQFSISTLFIICTLISSRQLHYIQHKDTGLKRSQIVVLDGDVLSETDRSALKSKLLAEPLINGVSASYDSPVNIQGGYNVNSAEGKSADFGLSVTAIPIEKDFVSVFEIPVLAGENLTDNDIARAQDTTDATYSFVVNKRFVDALQWTPEQAIGKQIDLNGRQGRIKMVVRDFNFATLAEEIQPVVLFPEYSYFGNIFVKVASGSDMKQAINRLEHVYKEVKPQTPFNYHFLDDDFAALYQHEQQTSRTMFLFSLITIGIACMGLFALAAFQAQQRVKEIGIRKVLGASVIKIVVMLTTNFVKMVLIALLIATPIAWWIMHDWLHNFAYRVDIEWWIFIVAGLLALAVSLLTISGQAIRAARTNPVDSLRDE